MRVEANIDMTYLIAALQKYRRLEREIYKVSDKGLRMDLAHTHSKLGMFLADGLGKIWRDLIETDHLNSKFGNSNP